jgi:hypothetical protein
MPVKSLHELHVGAVREKRRRFQQRPQAQCRLAVHQFRIQDNAVGIAHRCRTEFHCSSVNFKLLMEDGAGCAGNRNHPAVKGDAAHFAADGVVWLLNAAMYGTA